ncbi:MAG: hypothetical protein IJA34_05295 [Lachnospiraceae bacterium]|nr:hypothetical protein [Lachnospiraceae bacterium]
MKILTDKFFVKKSDIKYHSKNLYFTFTTFLYSFIIIFIGYNILDITGNYFFLDSNKISFSNKSDNNSYIFFAQTNNDIALFPWNYYKESLPLSKEFSSEENPEQLSLNYNHILTIHDSIDKTFNDIVSPELSVYLHNNNDTLYSIVDFDYIFDKLLTYTDSDGEQYFFYSENKSIQNETYNISFSFGRNLKLYSFKFTKVHSDIDITTDAISNGYTFLDQLITNGNVGQAVPRIDGLTFNIMKNPSDSYQIIESNGEFLLVSTRDMVVYYYDPVENKFTGFNHIF